MLFIEWRFWGLVLISLLVVTASILGLRHAGLIERRITRWSLRLLCIPMCLLGTLFTVFLLAGLGCESHSAPVYSPSGKEAARVESIDGGATGGNTSVEIFWMHGFGQANVFTGDWYAVGAQDIRWLSDSDLVISYDGLTGSCYSTTHIKITCIRKPH